MQSFIITYNLVNFVTKKSSGALVNSLFSKFLWMEQHASLIIIKWYKANFLSLKLKIKMMTIEGMYVHTHT